jgi:ketosteroid isomerase-like protein
MSSDLTSIARSFLAGSESLDDYLAFFAEDCVYKVANQPPVEGKPALSESAARFRSMVKRVQHDILSLHAIGDRVICEITAHYTRNDGSVVSLPCLDIFTFSGSKIKRLQVFVDLSPVFAP